MSLTRAAVHAASAAWVWFPAGASFDDADGALLVRYPSWWDHELEVARFDAGADLDAVVARARATGLPELGVWVRLDAPAGLEDALVARGSRVAETVDVLACDLRAGAPVLDAPDLEVRAVVDLATMRDSRMVVSTAFGGSMPPEEQLVADAEVGAQTWARGDGGAMVAYLDGTAVGTGGITVADGVARLWSGSVLEQARGQGVYRALLQARLDVAVARGAGLGLVKGRVATSGPILRRAGFQAFGEERFHLVRLQDTPD